MMNAPTITQDVNEFDQPGHLDEAPRRADHLSLNEVLFDVLRVVLTVVEGQRAQDEWRVERRGATRAGTRRDEQCETDHFSHGGC
jgi:hypothetical protein